MTKAKQEELLEEMELIIIGLEENLVDMRREFVTATIKVQDGIFLIKNIVKNLSNKNEEF